jgi:biotin operon repressor
MAATTGARHGIAKPRILREDALVARLTEFYTDNPDEELTYALIREKFGMSRGVVEKAIATLRRVGFLESVHVIRRVEKGARRADL